MGVQASPWQSDFDSFWCNPGTVLLDHVGIMSFVFEEHLFP